MNHRERFLNTMNYKPVDRAVYGVWTGWWPETEQRWLKEGFDPTKVPYYQVDHWEWQGGWFYPNPPFERTVIEETEDTVTYINFEGILMRERRDQPYSSMPQFLRHPVDSRESFRKFYKERMQPDMIGRAGADYVAKLEGYRQRDFPLMVVADRWGGFFGGLRNLVSLETACELYYDDPDFVEEMLDGIADLIIAVMSQVLDHTDVDVFGFWEDMAYKTAPLIGPKLARQFMLPRYKRVIEYLQSRGVKWFALDSDGKIDDLMPIWMEAGINILYPFEVQCGMDVNKIRAEYGRDLRIWFGIDKRALAIGPAAIDAELARVRPLMEEGGYIPGLDHSMPPDVPFANYQYYMEALWKMVNGK
jgi:hypothetical protein